MPTPYGAKFVKCPYYRNHDSNRIVCEGLCHGNTINLVYESQTDKKRYMENRCNSILGCRDCPVHRLLDQMYEEGDCG